MDRDKIEAGLIIAGIIAGIVFIIIFVLWFLFWIFSTIIGCFIPDTNVVIALSFLCIILFCYFCGNRKEKIILTRGVD